MDGRTISLDNALCTDTISHTHIRGDVYILHRHSYYCPFSERLQSVAYLPPVTMCSCNIVRRRKRPRTNNKPNTSGLHVMNTSVCESVLSVRLRRVHSLAMCGNRACVSERVHYYCWTYEWVEAWECGVKWVSRLRIQSSKQLSFDGWTAIHNMHTIASLVVRFECGQPR